MNILFESSVYEKYVYFNYHRQHLKIIKINSLFKINYCDKNKKLINI